MDEQPASTADLRWLWAARGTTLAIVLALSAVVIHSAWELTTDPCSHNRMEWLYPLSFLIPYAAILVALRTKTRKTGLALAVAWGSIFSGAILLVGLPLLVTTLRRGQPIVDELLVVLVFLLPQVALLASAIKAYYATDRPHEPESRARDRRTLRNGFLVSTSYVLLLLVGAALLPGLASPSPLARDHTALGWLRTLSTAQLHYAALHPEQGFAPTLEHLRREDLLPPEDSATGTKAGYRFTLQTKPDAEGRHRSFSITAQPLEYGRTGCRSFFVDETGVIRWTKEDRPATPADPALYPE